MGACFEFDLAGQRWNSFNLIETENALNVKGVRIII